MGFSFLVVCTNKRDEALVKSGSACVCVREHGLYGTGILFKECIERVSVISCWHDHTPGQGNPRVHHYGITLLSLNSRVMMMMMFIPRGWNLFFSGTGTADFHPEVLEKARPISPLR